MNEKRSIQPYNVSPRQDVPAGAPSTASTASQVSGFGTLTLREYDVYDRRELQPEYIADFAEKKARGRMEKIDYAVRIKGERRSSSSAGTAARMT